MKNGFARILALIVIAAALYPKCTAQSTFTGDCHRINGAGHTGWAHLSIDSDLNNGHEKFLDVSLEIFGVALNLSFTWNRINAALAAEGRFFDFNHGLLAQREAGRPNNSGVQVNL